MRHTVVRGATLPTNLGLYLLLALLLSGCTLGETVMPNPSPGVAADRSVGVVAAVPDPIPHALEGRQDCFACHATGAVDAPAVPAGHAQDVTLCTTCHAVWLAPAIAAAAAPAIPHDLTGRDDCLVCHKAGAANAPRVPDNHTGLPSSLCRTCHSLQGEVAGAGTGTGTPVAQASAIPHGLEGFRACTSCHEKGGPGIPQFPANHQGRTDDICSACHSPASGTPEATSTTEPTAEPTGGAPAVAGDAAKGQVLFTANCAICHGPNGEGTAIAPEALNNAAFLGEVTDGDLTTTIRMGVAGRMPPSPKLGDQDILDLIALLRSWN